MKPKIHHKFKYLQCLYVYDVRTVHTEINSYIYKRSRENQIRHNAINYANICLILFQIQALYLFDNFQKCTQRVGVSVFMCMFYLNTFVYFVLHVQFVQ